LLNSTYNALVAIDRISLEGQTAYAELLDRLVRDVAGSKPGSIVKKTIGGRLYYYAQHRGPGAMRQTYLGADSPEMRVRIARIEDAWSAGRERGRAREDLVRVLRASRLATPTAAEAKVLSALGDAGLFRVGGVLAGTHAFACIGNALGVRWEAGALRTADIDVVHDPAISVAIGPSIEPADLERLTREPVSGVSLWPIPGFDPREASTSFTVHGTQLHLDLLTPLRGRPRGPVRIPSLGASALPLRFLDYLVEETMPAAVVGGAGVLVTVPSPGRYALHKLIVATARPAFQATKANKDLAQAAALLEVLLEDRPADVRAGWNALLARGSGWTRRAKRSLARIDPAIARAIG
jgi:hypothetical protein